MERDLLIRGRHVRGSDLCQIKEVIAEHWERGRTAISQELCRLWDWRQHNGIYKEQVCRILLRQLEDRKLIELPAPKRGISNHPERRYYVVPDHEPVISTEPMEGPMGAFGKVQLKMVRRTVEEDLWNYLVYRYHYKSYKIIVGAHLKYMVYLEDRPIACLSWNSSVFRIACRDRFLGWDEKIRSCNIGYVVNNSRYLILPWVRIKYMASHILSLSARSISRDWEAFYGHRIYLLETFVDRSLFAGTCFKAANWILVGQTSGYAKKNNRFYSHGNRKDVYLYPLVRDFRERLLDESGRGGAR